MTGDRAYDEAAFAELFAAHHDAVLRPAYVMTSDLDAAEEAVADAFAAMFPHWRRGNVEDEAAYLRRAVVNAVRGSWRRRAVRRRHDSRRDAPSPAASSDAGLADRDVVRGALLALPAGQRAVVVLRFLDDRSEADTAEILGISVGTVKSQTSRALARLRAELGDASE